MDVTPYATPPTVPEEEVIELDVDVDFDGVGIRTVAVDHLRLASAAE
jgi:hypothetical protein